MKTIDPSLLASWAAVGVTLLGVLLGLAAVWWQIRKQWRYHSAQLVTDLDQIFSSADLRRQRRNFAELLSKHHRGETINLAGDIRPLIFFENIGCLVKRLALDEEMVWNRFSWIIIRYHLALTYRENLIHNIRCAQKEKLLYCEFEWLSKRTARLYRKKAGVNVGDPRIQEGWIEQLFDQEIRDYDANSGALEGHKP